MAIHLFDFFQGGLLFLRVESTRGIFNTIPSGPLARNKGSLFTAGLQTRGAPLPIVWPHLPHYFYLPVRVCMKGFICCRQTLLEAAARRSLGFSRNATIK